MDILFTGDIPSNYKYIYLKDGYIFLFNVPNAENETINCYKIDNNNKFIYCFDTFTTDKLINFTEVNTSNKHYYRTDYSNILTCSLIIGIVLIFILNLITTFIKRGGLLSGLF